MAPTIEPDRGGSGVDGPYCAVPRQLALVGPELDSAIEGVVRGIVQTLEAEREGTEARAALAKIMVAEADILRLTSSNSLAVSARSLLPMLAGVRERFLRVSGAGATAEAIRKALANEEEGWTLRNLVIADFDQDDFLGLKRRASDRELAVLSIIAGSVPGQRDEQLSVAEMLRLEAKAMHQARLRMRPEPIPAPEAPAPKRQVLCGGCGREGEIPSGRPPPNTRYLCSGCGGVLDASTPG